MFRLALKSALAKKRRLFGTALSVMLGVAFLAGTLVFTDTIQRTFDDLFSNIYAETDAVVRADTSIDLASGGSQRGRIPSSLLAKVAAVPGVSDAQGGVGGYAQLVDGDGKAIGNPGRGAPTMGMSFEGGATSPWRLEPGGRVPHDGEVVIDKASADVGGFELGDQVTVLTQTGPHRFRLVGIVRFGTVDSPGGASAALFDLETAQEVLLGGADELDSIWVDSAAGISQERLTARIAAVLPKGVEVVTGAEITAENQSDMRSALGFFSTFLLVFAGIGLVVACFTIYNTFQIIASQRLKEMALLRAVGATRGQVVAMQLLESVFVGLVASVLGLGAGVLVAGALQVLLGAVGIDIPGGGVVFEPRTAVLALGVGVVVTVGSAVLPALRGSRVPPVAAIRDIAAPASAHPKRRTVVQGGVLVGLGAMGFGAGLAGAGLVWVGAGALLVFVGVFTLSPLIARPVTRVLGTPIARLVGTTGLLARENAVRNPKRTARAGGALMIGVALVSAITIIAATAKDWSRDVIGQQFQGDFVVSTSAAGYGGINPEVAAELDRLPEVRAALGLRIGAAADASKPERSIGYVAVDPAAAAKVLDLSMVEGRIADLTGSGILVDDGQAKADHLAMGDQLRVKLVDGSTERLTVQGIYSKDDLVGPYVVAHALHERSGADQFDAAVYIVGAPGTSAEATRRAIEQVASAYPNAEVQSRDEYIDAQAGQVDQIVNLMYGLLALAVVIALVSIANSISLSVYERTRELGLLRAVGMTRHQIGSVVRWEAVLVSILGSALGAVLGVIFGWAIAVTLRDEGLAAVALPTGSLVVIVGLSVIGGVLASLRPGWRAAHLEVLPAIASE